MRALGQAESDGFKKWNSFGNLLDMKHKAEEYVEASGLDYTIFRPAPMSNKFPREVGCTVFWAPDTVFLRSDEAGKKVSRDDVLLACLDAVFNPKASRKLVELVGLPVNPPMVREQWWDV